jgi:DNA-binding response OmpR family regulator
MVYIIVTGNHEGHIDIESAEGAGTTFNIYLPKAEENRMIVESATTLAHRGTETILVIEDEHTVLKLAERALKHYGYTVLTAMNGVEGLDVFENNRETISLVLLDLTMPHMSGKEVIERLLDIDEEAKIIITSGHSDEEIRKYIQAKDFISKPYKLEDLTATIRKVLDGNAQ